MIALPQVVDAIPKPLQQYRAMPELLHENNGLPLRCVAADATRTASAASSASPPAGTPGTCTATTWANRA